MRRCLHPLIPNVRIVVLDELTGTFDIEAYNSLLKNPAFWAHLDLSQHVLIVQDDGMLVRRGLEDDPENFMQYDYVGAPWLDGLAISAELKRKIPTLVGNGGISLRRASVMRDICTSAATQGRGLFNNRLQPIPEDVYFAAEVCRRGGDGVCPTHVASKFAFEEIPPTESQRSPLGFHKPWAYMDVTHVAAFFQGALEEATTRA
jgi:hypothetical protein